MIEMCECAKRQKLNKHQWQTKFSLVFRYFFEMIFIFSLVSFIPPSSLFGFAISNGFMNLWLNDDFLRNRNPLKQFQLKFIFRYIIHLDQNEIDGGVLAL